jgi:hypothetical protein
VPAPDAPADATERAAAKAFAELIDKVVAGRPPAAVPAEQQELLEVATALRASVRPVELGASRRAAIVESALAAAIDRRAGGHGRVSASLPVVPIGRAAGRRNRAPWIVAATTSLVAAAALTLWLRDRGAERAAPPAPVAAAAAPLPVELRSRPADPLIGAIPAERAGAALDRIDTIYADRLDGFRARTMSGGLR